MKKREYRNSFLEYLHLEDMGIFTAADDENKSDELLTRIRKAGAALTDPDDHNVPHLVIRSGNVTVTTLAEARRNKEMSTSETVCSFL